MSNSRPATRQRGKPANRMRAATRQISTAEKVEVRLSDEILTFPADVPHTLASE